jgi:hypothetical protein
MGPQVISSLQNTQALCATHGMMIVPVRVDFSTSYLNLTTLELNLMWAEIASKMAYRVP